MEIDNHCSVLSGADHLILRDADSFRQLRFSLVGQQDAKQTLLNRPAQLQSIVALLNDPNAPEDAVVEAVLVLCSLAKSVDAALSAVFSDELVTSLLGGLNRSHPKQVETCLRCLRALFARNMVASDILYKTDTTWSGLLALIPQSSVTMDCVTALIASTCRSNAHQNLLHRCDVLAALKPVLRCSSIALRSSAVTCLALLVLRNRETAEAIVEEWQNDPIFFDIVKDCLNRDNPGFAQLAAAKVFTYIARAEAMNTEDPIIVYRVMPTLVRLIKTEQDNKPSAQMAEAASTLGYLLEESVGLQRLAAWNNQCLQKLTACMQFRRTDIASPSEQTLCDHLHAAVLHALASIASNDEDIRRKITHGTPGLLERIVAAAVPDEDADVPVLVQNAGVRCLLSLSRSVHQLRTTFKDRKLARPLIALLMTNTNPETMVVVSAVMANLAVEFSPCRDELSEPSVVAQLCSLAKSGERTMRTNGVWTLMNLSYKANESTKRAIVDGLGGDELLRLLTESDVVVVQRLMGILRNVFAEKEHIDSLMQHHSFHSVVLQMMTFILENDFDNERKQQALCVLANIAAGDNAKCFIVDNDDLLTKISNYLALTNPKLQAAAASCVTNLAWRDDPGSLDRHTRLREYGILTLLQQLINTDDPLLLDRVKRALHNVHSSS